MGDIDYTLRAWPNHHRALNSAIRLRLRGKNIGWSNKLPPAECYLSRAVNYSPKDGVARMLFGNLYAHMDEPLKALDMYQAAEQISPGNEQIKYNMGLVLVDLKRYQEAKDYAVGLYSRGFPLPGLKRQLEKNGYWKPKAK
jgi:tetratricopeptide (TPR) repeat protein